MRGGAVQILQTPTSFFYPNDDTKVADMRADTLGIPRFVFDNAEIIKNPKVSDVDDFKSSVLTRKVHRPRYPKIDMIDEGTNEYFSGADADFRRMA